MKKSLTIAIAASMALALAAPALAEDVTLNALFMLILHHSQQVAAIISAAAPITSTQTETLSPAQSALSQGRAWTQLACSIKWESR